MSMVLSNSESHLMDPGLISVTSITISRSQLPLLTHQLDHQRVKVRSSSLVKISEMTSQVFRLAAGLVDPMAQSERVSLQLRELLDALSSR